MSVSDNIKKNRLEKAQALRDMGVNPYASRFERTHTCQLLQTLHKDLAAGSFAEPKEECLVAGRVRAVRNASMFIVLQDHSGKIQLFCSPEVQKSAEGFLKNLDVGDIIGVKGIVRRTPRGELTIDVVALHMLTKSLAPLPEKYYGLEDVEKRYRQRYLDLIMNDDSKKRLMLRSLCVQEMRNALQEKGFLEVETPMLHTLAGGAVARPFVTHHNVLDCELYLRIAPELYLKKLIIGGLSDKIFEINRCFRNEGVSSRHNPEFTTLELYQAYADYNVMMALTENIVHRVVQKVCQSSIVHYKGKDVDFTTPWRRVSMLQAIKDVTGVDFHEHSERRKAIEVARTLGVHCEEDALWGQVVAAVFEKHVEHTIVHPTHITDLPTDISPLSRRHDQYAYLTERFETFVSGFELANAFSELSDPVDQLSRFSSGQDHNDDPESHHIPDLDFVEALEHGMPPTGGLGVGIDRLVMVLTDAASIRDVIAFPTMKPVSV